MARTILVVEDDEPTLTLIASALQKRGHRVLRAMTCQQAEDFWTEPGNTIDLLIADVRLSVKEDGFGLAKKLLELKPGVPVIFISGDRDCFSCPEINFFGDAPFIAKPFSLNKMLESVDQILTTGAAGRV